MKTIAILIACAVPFSAWCQAEPSARDATERRIGTTSQNNAVSAKSALQINAEQGASAVTLTLSKTLSESTGPSGTSFQTLSWTVQAPLNKSEPSTVLANLDGLANATTAELKFTQTLSWGMNKNAAEKLSACQRIVDPVFAKLRDAKDKRVADIKESQCDLGFAYSILDAEQYAELENVFYQGFRSLIWGVSAKGGYQDFSYFDSTSLAKSSSRKSPWSASAFIAFHNEDLRSLFSATYTAQDAFKDATAGVACPTGQTTSPILCVSGPIGLPTSKKARLLTLEIRRALSARTAIALSVTRDFENKLSGVEVPIYFLPGPKGELTGGIRVGWTSKDKKATAGLFITQPFKVLN